MGDDDIDVESNHFCKERGQSVVVPVRPTEIDDDIASLLIPELAHGGPKGFGSFGQTVGGR